MRSAHDGPVDFATSMTLGIRDRSHDQVRDLRVEMIGDQVVIQGRTRTHYAKQLAHHGALDFLRGQTLINRIVVG